MSASSNGALPKALRTAFERGGEMGRRMLALDWAELAARASRRTGRRSCSNAVGTMLASRAQIVIFYGPDYCALYNDGYVPTMGSKHPGYLGRPGREMWAEAWAVLQDLFDGVVRRRRGVLGRRPPLHAGALRLPRGDLLRHLVRPDPHRRRLGRRGVLHRQRDHRPGARRAAGPHAQRARLPAGRPGRPGRARRPGGRRCSARTPRTCRSPRSTWTTRTAAASSTLAGSAGAPPEACRRCGRGPARPSRRCCGPGARTGCRSARCCDPPPVAAADEALVLPVGIGTANAGALVVGVSRYLALDRDYRDFLDLADRADLPGGGQPAGVRAGAPPGRGAGRAGHRQDQLLLQRQPRVPYPADPDPRPAGGSAGRPGPAGRAARPAAADAPQRVAAAQAGQHRAGLLPAGVRPAARRATGRPTSPITPPGWPAPSARRPSGPGCGSWWTARRCPRRSSWTARCGRRSSSTCSPTRSSSPGTAASRSGSSRRRRRRGAGGQRHRRRHPAGRAAAALRPVPPGHRRLVAQPRGHRHRAGAGPRAGRAARRHGRRATARSAGAAPSRSPSRSARRTCRADRLVDGRVRWSPSVEHRGSTSRRRTGGPASRSAPAAGGDRQHGGVRNSRRGRILLADDNADLRDHVARLLRPHWDVTAVDGRAGGAGAGHAPSSSTWC